MGPLINILFCLTRLYKFKAANVESGLKLYGKIYFLCIFICIKILSYAFYCEIIKKNTACM